MKKQDLIFFTIIVLIFLPFFISDPLYNFYVRFNTSHGFIMSFLKFAILATYGEVLGLRIRTGKYHLDGFGLFPRMIVWGFLGLTIKAAFISFSAGGPAILAYLGMDQAASVLAGELSWGKLLAAFSISFTLNLTFSPVLMTFHRISDTHIMKFGGRMRCFINPPDVRNILEGFDWKMHWDFVLWKSIPFFWIPAHTVTFLLPVDFQILFAALLGVVLGVILAFAAGRETD
jgi:hypothetical protein